MGKGKDFDALYRAYISNLSKFKSKGYKVTEIQKQFFKAVYLTQLAINKQLAKSSEEMAYLAKENVVRQLARQSRDVTYTQAIQARSELIKDIKENYQGDKELIRVMIQSLPTVKEIISKTTAEAFDLLISDRSDTEQFRRVEAIYYPGRAATRGRGYKNRSRRKKAV